MSGASRDDMGRFLTFRDYAEHYSGETGFYGPHGWCIRACSAADQVIAALRADLEEMKKVLA
jgi:hypothetical protein